GHPWTDAELAVALDPRHTTTTAARQLGRSRAAVHRIRQRNPGWRDQAGG
ncbi:hypothetical protein G3I71_48485, partial [Streptomyces sp. SID12501]|nr:hypothetical protein [Streptomyces sp. SID12501]